MSNQYQLTNVEAQRIMAVLDEMSSDLRYAFRLTPQHLASIGDIASVVVCFDPITSSNESDG